MQFRKWNLIFFINSAQFCISRKIVHQIFLYSLVFVFRSKISASQCVRLDVCNKLWLLSAFTWNGSSKNSSMQKALKTPTKVFPRQKHVAILILTWFAYIAGVENCVLLFRKDNEIQLESMEKTDRSCFAWWIASLSWKVEDWKKTYPDIPGDLSYFFWSRKITLSSHFWGVACEFNDGFFGWLVMKRMSEWKCCERVNFPVTSVWMASVLFEMLKGTKRVLRARVLHATVFFMRSEFIFSIGK